MLEAATTAAERLEARLRAEHPGLLESAPISRYVAWLDAVDPRASYSTMPADAVECAARLRDEYGREATGSYHKLVLSRLAGSYETRLAGLGLPESVEEATHRFLARVVGALARPESGDAYQLGHDRFAKDLTVALGRMVVCGPELVDLHGGIPRRDLFHPPRSAIPSRLAFVLGRVGGFAPLLESHLDRRLAREFTPAGYDVFYHRLADILRSRPRLRGYVGAGAWFCDPALASVSPELSYLIEVPLSNGAKLIPVDTTETTVRDALRLSPARSAAYDSGSYTPRSFMVVWPRRDLLRWAA